MLKRVLPCLLAAVMLLTGCQTQSNQEQNAADAQVTETTQTTQETQQPEEAETRIFVDSADREVEIPTQIDKVAASGVPAQMVLFTVCPDKMVGLARQFSEENLKYLDEKYQNMTEFGQFYGKNANLNMEALLKADPDVIIDIGEYKDSIASDMDGLQQQIGIPVVFIEADLENYDKTYAMLQDLLGEEEPAATMEGYARTTIEQAKEISAQIGEEEKKSVYMALGENGLSTNAKGSYHAQILELVGAENAADTQMDNKGGGSEISFEQLMLWNPDVIITDQEDTYQMILQDEMWSTLDAVKNGQVYKIPTAPFNFVSDPPSVNRLIGISWLGNLIYPEKYSFDQQTLIEFSDLFYHTALTEQDAQEILLHAVAE